MPIPKRPKDYLRRLPVEQSLYVREQAKRSIEDATAARERAGKIFSQTLRILTGLKQQSQ